MGLEHLKSLHGLTKCLQISLQIALYVIILLATSKNYTWYATLGLTASLVMFMIHIGSVIYGVILTSSFQLKAVRYECGTSFLWIIIWILECIPGSCLYHLNDESGGLKSDIKKSIEDSVKYHDKLPYIFTSIMMMSQIGISLIVLNNAINQINDKFTWIEIEKSPSQQSLTVPESSSIQTLSSIKTPRTDQSPSIQTLSSSTNKTQTSSTQNISTKKGNLIFCNARSSLLKEYCEEEVKEKYESPKRDFLIKAKSPKKDSKDESSIVTVVDKTPKIVAYIDKKKMATIIKKINE